MMAQDMAENGLMTLTERSQNSKLKDIKIEKPLPLLDLSKYKVDTSCHDLLTELTKVHNMENKSK